MRRKGINASLKDGITIVREKKGVKGEQAVCEPKGVMLLVNKHNFVPKEKNSER
jgi:hypothetical protein